MPRDAGDDRDTRSGAGPGPIPSALDIEPRRVDGRRRSRLPALAVIVAAALVVVTVVRPWGIGDRGTSPARSPAPRPGTSAVARGPDPTPFAHPPGIADLEAAARPHAGWGIRAIVVPEGSQPAGDGSGTGLEERWSPVDLAGDTWNLGVAVSPVERTEAVIAIGISTPPDTLPLDMRFWRLGDGDTPSRIVPVPIAGPDPVSWLWLPDADDVTTLGTWPAGRYRIDVLLGSRVARLVTEVPGSVGPADEGPSPVPPPGDLAAGLRMLPAGPFAVAAGHPIAIVGAALSRPLDERAEWLAAPQAGVESSVGLVPSADVSVLGAVLPVDVDDPHLWIDMLTPISGAVRAPIEVIALGPAPASLTAPSPIPAAASSRTAVFERSEAGRPFATGIYQLTASWTDGAGVYRAQVWHVEVTPALLPATPSSPLAALRRWTGLAAVPGGTRGEPIVTDLDALGGPGSGTCGIEAQVTPADRLLAVATPPGAASIGARLLDPYGATLDTRLLPGGPETGGLALLALPATGLAQGTYRLELDLVNGPPASYLVCVS